MTGNKKLKIPSEVFVLLEEKITKRVIKNIEEIIVQKCKRVFDKSYSSLDKEIIALLQKLNV